MTDDGSMVVTRGGIGDGLYQSISGTIWYGVASTYVAPITPTYNKLYLSLSANSRGIVLEDG
jgi:hypothetical protein